MCFLLFVPYLSKGETSCRIRFVISNLCSRYLAEDEVVDDGGDLTPRIVVPAFREEHVLESKRLALGGGWVCNS